MKIATYIKDMLETKKIVKKNYKIFMTICLKI